MSIVNIRNIELLNNPGKFDDDFKFRIKFEAMAPLSEDVEWRLIYVGSANSEQYDQELDSCEVGPIPAGVNAFEFEAPAPDKSRLPSNRSEDVLGVTVIIITASYRDKEFVRVGYYVNTYYEDQAMAEEPPAEIQWDKLSRNVLIEKPKVTRFQNPWDTGATSEFGSTPTEIVEVASGGGMNYMLSAAEVAPVQKQQQQTQPYQSQDQSSSYSNGQSPAFNQNDAMDVDGIIA